MAEEKTTEEMFEELEKPKTAIPVGGFEAPLRSEFDIVDYHPFQIDYANRKIRIIPTKRIASDTRKFMKLHPDFLVSGVLEADTTETQMSGTIETELNSYTIPLNMLSRNSSITEKCGNVVRIYAAGVYEHSNTIDTMTVRFKVGSTTYHSIISPSGSVRTNVPWIATWTVMIRSIGASGVAQSTLSAKLNNINNDNCPTSTFSIDTTANQKFSVTGQFSNSGNSIMIRQFFVEILN